MTLTLTPDYPLSKHTWLGVGGKADFFCVVENLDDLKKILKTNAYPITLLGAGSNILIRDGGIEGVVLKLGKDFQKIEVKNDTLICGAGVRLSEIAKVALENELSGFEFMADIPGTLGGGLASNAGAFGRALNDCLIQINALTFDGSEKIYTDLQEKIKHFKEPSQSKGTNNIANGYNISMTMMTDLLGCILVGLAVGLLFQKVFHKSVLLTAGLTLLGGIAGFYTVIRFILAEEKKQK